MSKQNMERQIRFAVLKAIKDQTNKRYIPGASSNRHVHLCREDIDKLFGKGYELTILKELSQPGQYAAKEVVSLVGPKGRIDKIRVLGPERKDTQVEISITDSYKLGIKPTIRMSGEVANTPGGTLISETGSAEIAQGVIVSARHIHISAEQAKAYNVCDGQVVSLKTTGERSVVFENVLVRSGEGHDLEVHLDTDEANAAGLKNGDLMEIV